MPYTGFFKTVETNVFCLLIMTHVAISLNIIGEKSMKILLFQLLALSLLGCTDDNYNSKNENKEKAGEALVLRNVHFKSDEALIKTKYKFAKLKCITIFLH